MAGFAATCTREPAGCGGFLELTRNRPIRLRPFLSGFAAGAAGRRYASESESDSCGSAVPVEAAMAARSFSRNS